MRRGDHVRALITRLGAFGTPDAAGEIERLLALAGMQKLKFALEGSRHQLQLNQREIDFRFPELAEVAQGAREPRAGQPGRSRGADTCASRRYCAGCVRTMLICSGCSGQKPSQIHQRPKTVAATHCCRCCAHGFQPSASIANRRATTSTTSAPIYGFLSGIRSTCRSRSRVSGTSRCGPGCENN